MEVNFAYSHKYAQALMDRLLNLADNVTETRTGVADANRAISQLDNVSPRKTHELVTAMSTCMSCTTPAGESKPRPWYADRNALAAETAAHRLYYRRVPRGTRCAPTAAWAPTTPRRVGARTRWGRIPRWVRRGARRWRRRWTRGVTTWATCTLRRRAAAADRPPGGERRGDRWRE